MILGFLVDTPLNISWRIQAIWTKIGENIARPVVQIGEISPKNKVNNINSATCTWKPKILAFNKPNTKWMLVEVVDTSPKNIFWRFLVNWTKIGNNIARSVADYMVQCINTHLLLYYMVQSINTHLLLYYMVQSISTHLLLYYMVQSISTHLLLYYMVQSISTHLLLYYMVQSISTHLLLYYMVQSISTHLLLYYMV